ncbi:hypothetical protein PAPYR_7950 [Paratrimastix pyriformis]|uniref:Uncharacterized protein n=1 Tax=Paratrimastix pyriformis TaxID=342808 RepID=A0ABQ8UGB7_9EUKA|nr:hypothetical protein PAPYR_7950 [Paratrimastix pyriformis]
MAGTGPPGSCLPSCKFGDLISILCEVTALALGRVIAHVRARPPWYRDLSEVILRWAEYLTLKAAFGVLLSRVPPAHAGSRSRSRILTAPSPSSSRSATCREIFLGISTGFWGFPVRLLSAFPASTLSRKVTSSCDSGSAEPLPEGPAGSPRRVLRCRCRACSPGGCNVRLRLCLLLPGLVVPEVLNPGGLCPEGRLLHSLHDPAKRRYRFVSDCSCLTSQLALARRSVAWIICVVACQAARPGPGSMPRKPTACSIRGRLPTGARLCPRALVPVAHPKVTSSRPGTSR